MLELAFANYRDISVRESTILQLHGDMLMHSEKDARHKGQYKFGSNRVGGQGPKWPGSRCHF
jgi:hypothetical protein